MPPERVGPAMHATTQGAKEGRGKVSHCMSFILSGFHEDGTALGAGVFRTIVDVRLMLVEVDLVPINIFLKGVSELDNGCIRTGTPTRSSLRTL